MSIISGRTNGARASLPLAQATLPPLTITNYLRHDWAGLSQHLKRPVLYPTLLWENPTAETYIHITYIIHTSPSPGYSAVQWKRGKAASEPVVKPGSYVRKERHLGRLGTRQLPKLLQSPRSSCTINSSNWLRSARPESGKWNGSRDRPEGEGILDAPGFDPRKWNSLAMLFSSANGRHLVANEDSRRAYLR
jgi:hypothetical protein